MNESSQSSETRKAKDRRDLETNSHETRQETNLHPDQNIKDQIPTKAASAELSLSHSNNNTSRTNRPGGGISQTPIHARGTAKDPFTLPDFTRSNPVCGTKNVPYRKTNAYTHTYPCNTHGATTLERRIHACMQASYPGKWRLG